jgi:hypothetical protein
MRTGFFRSLFLLSEFYPYELEVTGQFEPVPMPDKRLISLVT